MVSQKKQQSNKLRGLDTAEGQIRGWGEVILRMGILPVCVPTHDKFYTLQFMEISTIGQWILCCSFISALQLPGIRKAGISLLSLWTDVPSAWLVEKHCTSNSSWWRKHLVRLDSLNHHWFIIKREVGINGPGRMYTNPGMSNKASATVAWMIFLCPGKGEF